jgi:transcriptional regulator with XRE-family HTH domain
METNDIPADFGQQLAQLRKSAGKTQGELGSTVGMDASKISRIEDGKTTAGPSDVAALLGGLGTDESKRYRKYLDVGWKFVTRVPFKHPDLESIERAERGLQKIENLRNMNPTSAVLAQAEMYEGGLKRAGSYLLDTDHGVAFVGEIGVGKTTALCMICGLTVPTPDKPAIENVLLEIGAGGTTICEVVIKTGSGFRLNIEAYSQEEIIQFVDDFCISLTDARDGVDRAERGVPKEIDRALRNMAGLKRIQSKSSDGQRTKTDPALELAKKHSPESLRSEIFNLLHVWERTATELSHDPSRDGDGRGWTQTVFGEINKGQRKDISLPKRITVFVPETLIPNLPLNITVVDTRGIDGSPLRPDLKGCLDNPRVVSVLCSGFNEAPGPIFEQLVKQILETGSSESVFGRCVGIALAHDGEARKMKNDEGFVESISEGYELKIDQAQAKFKSWGCDQIPVRIYNANSDEPATIASFLTEKVEGLRRTHVQKISQIALELNHLVKDHESALLSKAQDEVLRRLAIFLRQHRSLPQRSQAVHSRLAHALRSEHPRSVWATIRRQGSWPVLDFYFYLGVGTAIDANKRADPVISGLGEVANNMLGDATLAPAHGFLKQLRENVKTWHDNFIEELTRIGESTFKPGLKNAASLWQVCAERYGQGRPGYRDDVAESVKHWFEQPEQAQLHSLLEEHVVRAWERLVLAQLERLCSLSPERPGPTDLTKAA